MSYVVCMRRSAFIAFLLLASSAVHAGSWQSISFFNFDHNALAQLLVDSESIRVRHGVLTAWIKIKYDVPQDDGAPAGKVYRSEIDLWGFKCADESGATFESTAYEGPDATGTVIFVRETAYPQWREVVPGSIFEKAMNLACASSTVKQ